MEHNYLKYIKNIEIFFDANIIPNSGEWMSFNKSKYTEQSTCKDGSFQVTELAKQCK